MYLLQLFIYYSATIENQLHHKFKKLPTVFINVKSLYKQGLAS